MCKKNTYIGGKKMQQIQKIILSLSLFFIGCDELPLGSLTSGQAKSGGIGFTAGVATAKTAQKVKEVFTPDFDIFLWPSKFCERFWPASAPKPLVQCVITPCVFDTATEQEIQENCLTVEDEDVFWEREKKVESLDTSVLKLSTMANICERLPDTCKDKIGMFKGKTVMFVDKK